MRAAAIRTICSCRELSSRYGTARSSGRSSHRPQTTAMVTTTQGPNQGQGVAAWVPDSGGSGRGATSAADVTTGPGLW
jgi:hypothetical protein